MTDDAARSDNTSDEAIPVFLNPLAFLKLDVPWSPSDSDPVTADDVIEFMCPPTVARDIAAITARYKQISTEDVRLSLAPNEDRIMTAIVWPLRHAKAGFLTGNFAGTVSLSGSVAEASAILLFDVQKPTLKGGEIAKGDQEGLFGKPYDRLTQYRRIRVLQTLGLTTDDAHTRFERLRTTRNTYVHPTSKKEREPEADAVQAYRDAVWLACFVIGQDFEGGRLKIRQSLLDYLKRGGAAS